MVKPATARSSQQALAIVVMLAIRLMILAKGFSDIADRVQKEPDDCRLALAKYLLSNLAGGGGEWRNTPTSSLPSAISRLPASEMAGLKTVVLWSPLFSASALTESMKQKTIGISPSDRVTTIEQLESIYGAPNPNSLGKEIEHISDHYRAFIEKAPFVTVATCGPEGLDCSPRGDPPGFVRVVDEKTVMIPDRRGNNRIDSMRNLVRDPRISLLFLIPGVNETLRINGRAEIVVDPELCASFEMQGKLPRAVLVVTVDRIYFQCQKALVRSRLWDVEAQLPRSELPSTGEILEALSKDDFDGAEYDRSYPGHLNKTIY